MSELEKYHVVKGYDLDIFIEQLNAFVARGYKVHTFRTDWEQGEHLGLGDRHYAALMSLSSSTKYDDIERLVDVRPDEVNSWLDRGYVVADSWAKNIRMVKKK